MHSPMKSSKPQSSDTVRTSNLILNVRIVMKKTRLTLSKQSRLFDLKPFVPNAPFLYLLKALENRKFFWCFHWVQKESIGKKRVNHRIMSFGITQAGIYLFKDNNRNTTTRCEICPKLTIMTPEQRQTPYLDWLWRLTE